MCVKFSPKDLNPAPIPYKNLYLLSDHRANGARWYYDYSYRWWYVSRGNFLPYN